jgi:hypothetical protein
MTSQVLIAAAQFWEKLKYNTKQNNNNLNLRRQPQLSSQLFTNGMHFIGSQQLECFNGKSICHYSKQSGY